MSELEKSNQGYFNSDLFTATVVSCDPGTMVVEIAPHGQGKMQKMQGIPLSQTFAAALGFKETILPTVGSSVFCQGLNGNTAVIFGTMPLTEGKGETVGDLPFKLALSAQDPLLLDVHKRGYGVEMTKLNSINNGVPTDVVQGEKVICNEFGVLLGLFQLMAQLRASDLAQVQCHFLDDLVRIVSHNFQHYTALGELNVSHDGQAINLEVGATHNPHESLGMNPANMVPTLTAAAHTDPVTPGTSEHDFFRMTKNAKALERLKLFVGKLGGLVNLLIGYPVGQLPLDPVTGVLQAGVNPDIGLLQVKANLDGTLVVRSASGIYLEKTNWIRVPQRVKSPEDPTGDDGTVVNYPVHNAYAFKDDYKYRDTAFLYYLQLKDYLAYTNEELGYADFKKLSGDFYVNDDYSKTALPQSQVQPGIYIDPYTKTTFKRSRSVFALMSNGGISMCDNWGSSISMEGGNIYIQPAKDLIVQPNRNIVAKVGGNVSIAARKEIDISSTTGGFRLKTENAQHLYSHKSGILLHSDGAIQGDGVTTYSAEHPQLHGTPTNYSTVTKVPGIVFYAPNSSISGSSKQVYLHADTSMLLDALVNTIHSDSWLRLYSKQSITANSNVFDCTANGQISIYSKRSAILVGETQTTVGLKEQTFGLAEFGENKGIPVKGILDPQKGGKSFIDAMNKINKDANELQLSSLLYAFKDVKKFSEIKFQYMPSVAYGLQPEDALPQTMYQQQAELNRLSREIWTEYPVNGSYPYPGAGSAATSYVTSGIRNVTTVGNDVVNKTSGLVAAANDIVKQNIFTSYPINI